MQRGSQTQRVPYRKEVNAVKQPTKPKVALRTTSRKAVTPKPLTEKRKEQQPGHQPRKSSQYAPQPPEDWSKKLSSDQFLQQWYSNKNNPEALAEATSFPLDQEEIKSSKNEKPAKTSLLSKFLTSSVQPKVEAKADAALYETTTEEAKQQKPRAKPNKNITNQASTIL